MASSPCHRNVTRQFAERFGTNVVYRADDLNKPPARRLAPTLDFLHARTLD